MLWPVLRLLRRSCRGWHTPCLHDALRILTASNTREKASRVPGFSSRVFMNLRTLADHVGIARTSASSSSEEHTSELQSPTQLVCRLLLVEKKRRGRRLAGKRRPDNEMCCN